MRLARCGLVSTRFLGCGLVRTQAFLAGEYARAPDDERGEGGDFYFGPPEHSTVFYQEVPDPDHLAEKAEDGEGYYVNIILMHPASRQELYHCTAR